MAQKSYHSKSDPRAGAETLKSLLSLTILFIPLWKLWLRPGLSGVVETMIREKQLPIEIAESLDDIGHFLQRLAAEIMLERQRAGMPLPPGPED